MLFELNLYYFTLTFLILYCIFLFIWLCWMVICSRPWASNGLLLNTYISMYTCARTKRYYNEQGKVKLKVKYSRYKPGVAQRVPGN
jgi:hypothetical protein